MLLAARVYQIQNSTKTRIYKCKYLGIDVTIYGEKYLDLRRAILVPFMALMCHLLYWCAQDSECICGALERKGEMFVREGNNCASGMERISTASAHCHRGQGLHSTDVDS